MYSWLTDALAEGGAVITANRRLARDLRDEYDRQQIASGKKTWLTADVHSLNAWLKHTIDSAVLPTPPPRRMDPYSASVLWERCLLEHSDKPVLSFGGVVRQALQSWQRLHDWRVPLREITASAQSRDEHLFANAAWSYQKLLQSNHWVDAAGLSAQFSNLLAAGSLTIPLRITLAGFDRQSPAVKFMLKQIRDRGCVVADAPIRQISGQVRLGCFPEEASELRAAGAWARAELLRSPGAKVAIVSAMLEQNTPGTVRLIREGFVPGWQYGGPEHQTAINVSYGRRLTDFPIIAVALNALRWASRGLATRELGGLLRSPFLGGPVVPARTRLELRLREIPNRVWSPGDLSRLQLAADSGVSMAGWQRSERALESLWKQGQQERSTAEWAARVDHVLQEIQWPGIADPDSGEYQLINRWRELLNEFAGTEYVQPRMKFQAAMRHLAVMAGDIVYQPETTPGVLQVLGKLEASGIEFDRMWICGLDAASWPAISRPSSLISRRLQREFEMPDATPGDTLDYSRRLLQRLAASAADIVFSWSRTDDEAELAPSPLLDDFETMALTDSGDPGWHAASRLDGASVRIVVDDPVPTVASGEKIAGGAYTVQLQSIEPLAAFTAGRLRASQIRRVETGISPGLRGSLIHQALHTLYRSCPSQQEIRSWLTDDASGRISLAVDDALAPHRKYADKLLGRLLDFERIRLGDLLRQFLQAETEREDFTITEVEKKFELVRSGVRLGIRIDRVDRLSDGGLLIIDYKTGAISNLVNQDGKPADLQLVVYSCAVDERVGGLALMNIDSRAINYKATGSDVEWDSMDDGEWTERLTSWQAIVDRALHELAAGDVRINLQLSAKDGRSLNLLSRLEEHKREQ